MATDLLRVERLQARRQMLAWRIIPGSISFKAWDFCSKFETYSTELLTDVNISFQLNLIRASMTTKHPSQSEGFEISDTAQRPQTFALIIHPSSSLEPNP